MLRSLASLASLASLGLFSTPCILSAERVPPNIILILADDLGYSDLACYGNDRNQSTHLDQMAREGQRWTEFYSASHICSPSRAALLTGLYPVRTGTDAHVFFEWSAEGLPHDSVTLAEVLKENGYRTYCIGKWHLGHKDGYLPIDQGFDYFYGIPYSNDMRVDPDMKVADTVVFREGMTEDGMRDHANKIDNWIPLMEGDALIEYPADQNTLTRRYTEQSLTCIAQSIEEKTPFFLFIAHHLPHVPIFVSDSIQSTVSGNSYAQAIAEIDASVGQILAYLKASALADNSLVIFTSDNGPDQTFNLQGGRAEPLKGSKFYASEGGQKVPTLFWWPNKIPTGEIDALGSTLDIYNTALSLAGISDASKQATDSYDLSPVLFHQSESPRKDFYYFSSFIEPRGQIYAVRKGDWKAHFYQSQSPEYYNPKSIVKHPKAKLYNLKEDPGENTDLADTFPHIVKDLEKHSEAFSKDIQRSIAPNRYSKKILHQVRPDWAQ